jgi:hypothetical protein
VKELISLSILFYFFKNFSFKASPGGTANEISRLHALHLVQKKLDTLAYLNETKDEDVAALVKASTTLIDTVVNSIESDNVYNLIRILGFDAGKQLAATFLTVAVSGIAAVIRSLDNS